jgi:hypothetical protein
MDRIPEVEGTKGTLIRTGPPLFYKQDTSSEINRRVSQGHRTQLSRVSYTPTLIRRAAATWPLPYTKEGKRR